ncbi:MAG: ADP-glyceromanno-heptose 6-epimerase [Desulfobacteraceae bacterium]|jgi:ADP-L-glycero-D-manno-heptose 6-epimerase
MKRVIVTGGAGFIGSCFVRKLNREGIDDILIVDDLKDSEKWKNLRDLRFSDYIHKNVFLETVNSGRLKYDPQAVVHMGACSSTTENNADYLMENNYRFTRILAEWAAKRDIRFLYASSAATYGDGRKGFSDGLDLHFLYPLNKYAYSKHLFDLYAERYGLFNKIIGLKYFNVFGPNEYHKGEMASVVLKAFNQIKEKGNVNLFKSHRDDYADGEQMRDFIYVKDCVDVMWWLLMYSNVNGLFNLGTGCARSWNDLIKAVFSAMGLETNINYIDMPLAIRDNYQYFTQAEMGRLRETGCPLDFQSLEETVRDYIVNHLQVDQPQLKDCLQCG